MTTIRPPAAMLLTALLVSFALPSGRAAAADKKFPHPVVDTLLKGWNGLAWGATLDEFKKKFPDAARKETGRWVTGKGTEDLAGLTVNTQYTFNKKDQLMMVNFEPEEKDKATFRKALQAAGVLREGPKANWTNSGVSFVVADVDGVQFAVCLSAKFKDPAEKKAK
jgi:hypothetical protein